MTRQTGANRASERSNRRESLTRGTGEDGGVEADALRDSAGGVVTESGVIQGYRGPLPPPAAFQAYETTLPGAADRILGLTEKQQDHRHRMELREQDRADQWQELAMRDRAQARGIVFVLALVLLAGGVGLLTFGQQLAGTAVLSVSILQYLWTLVHRIWLLLERRNHDRTSVDSPPAAPRRRETNSRVSG